MDKKIFATAWHPSATNLIIPIIKRLKEEGNNVIVLGTKYSCPIFEKNKIDYNLPEQYGIIDFSEKSMSEILQQESPDFILTGASFQDLNKNELDIPDQTILIPARESKIPTLKLHDYWKDMGKYLDKRTNEIRFLPDKIALFDNYAKQKLLEAGLPEDKLVVMGNPEADNLIKFRENFYQEKNNLLKKLNLKFPDNLFFYAGGIEWEKNKKELGYSNIDHVNLFTSVLNEIPNEKLSLIMALHPRMPNEEQEKIKEYLEQNKDDRIKFIAGLNSIGVSSEEVSLASKLTYTAFSTVGIKAVYMGKPCISLQPNLIIPSDFKDGEVEFFINNPAIPLGNDYRTCKELIKKSFTNKNYLKNLEENAKNSNLYIRNESSPKIVNLIYDMIFQ